MRGGAIDVSGVGSGATVSPQGVVIGWAPTSSDDTLGGPGSVNPLLNADGTLAIDPEWPVEYSGGKAGAEVVASPATLGPGGVKRVSELAGLASGPVRSITLNFSEASGADVELLRRMLVTTLAGSGTTRNRVPGLEVGASVLTAPKYRWIPQRVRITRSASGQTARVEGITLERVE